MLNAAKKTVLAVLLCACASLPAAEGRAPAAPPDALPRIEGLESVDTSVPPDYVERFVDDSRPYSQKEKEAIRSNRDATSVVRAQKTLGASARILEKVGATPESFPGETLGVPDFVWVSVALLLLIYGAAGAGAVHLASWVFMRISAARNTGLFKELLGNVKSPLLYLAYAAALYASLIRLSIALGENKIFENAFTIVFMSLYAWLFLRVYDALARRVETLARKKDGVKDVFPIFRKFIRWMIIVFALLTILSRLGFDVKGLMLSLGIGGAALAFASKDTIANFFGSVSLIMDAPFRIGDRIQVSGKLDGTVESIGIRSTRIRNLDQTVSILPNSYLANEYIVNVTRWKKRKVAMKIGLVYSTTADQMRSVVGGIAQMLKSDPDVNGETILVNFSEFAESSLNISITYFTNSVETAKYLEVSERVNFAIMEIVAKNGTQMAFPTRSVYIEKQ